LYRHIIQCLQDPDLCRETSSGTRVAMQPDKRNTAPPSAVIRTGAWSRAPANLTGARTPPGASPLQRPATISGENAARTDDVRADDARIDDARIGDARSGNANSGDARSGAGENLARTVDEVAHDLPLDPATFAISDTIPANAAVIERRLGLRRPHVEARDLRARTPTLAELVQALAPDGRPAS
jgi:hypothetical protein